MDTLLDVRDVTITYDGIVAVRGVSLSVPTGSIVAVIGANGAGKKTLLCALMGQLKLSSGSVLYGDRDISGVSPYKLVRRGMTMVPQDRGTLSPLSVRENLLLAADRVRGKAAKEHALDEVYE